MILRISFSSAKIPSSFLIRTRSSFSSLEDCKRDSVAVVTPHGMRQIKKNVSEIQLYTVYLNVPRRDRFIASLKRGDGSSKAIEETKRRDGSDVGQYDGIVDEVDVVIDNKAYRKTPREICDEIIAKIGDM